jgi:hypothetical protein
MTDDLEKWSADLQKRLIAEGEDEEQGVRNTMAEAACLLAALTQAARSTIAAPAQESVTDDDLLEAIEQEVGMSHGGWDMVATSEILAAFRKHLRATPASTAAPVVPEGFVPVPIEPTEAMCAAGNDASAWHVRDADDIYRAMLSAAPKPDA